MRASDEQHTHSPTKNNYLKRGRREEGEGRREAHSSDDTRKAFLRIMDLAGNYLKRGRREEGGGGREEGGAFEHENTRT